MSLNTIQLEPIYQPRHLLFSMQSISPLIPITWGKKEIVRHTYSKEKCRTSTTETRRNTFRKNIEKHVIFSNTQQVCFSKPQMTISSILKHFYCCQPTKNSLSTTSKHPNNKHFTNVSMVIKQMRHQHIFTPRTST